VFNPGNDFDFLPAGTTATVVINYTMRDDRFEPLPTEITASSSSTLTITVNGENDAPVAVGNSHTTAEDTPLNIAAPGVLGNDSDVDFGTTLTAVQVVGPAHGTLTLNTDGSFEYVPAADYYGPDSFTYKANDGALDSNVVTVNITVTPVDDFDFGDAPVSYGVASHFEGAGFIGGVANSGPLLSTRDFELANQASANADGDDLNSSDDENGVTFNSTTLVPRFNTTITVNATTAGRLDAWIDYNRNGLFDAGEKIANGLNVSVGSNTLIVPVPDNLTSGVTFARFRISTAGISLPTGLAADGEVEDYKLSIEATALNSARVIDDPENPGSESPDVLLINGSDGFLDAIVVRVTRAATLTLPAMVTVYIAPNVSVGSFPLNTFGRIVIFGRAGNDSIAIESPINKPSTIYGDTGNDTISGGLGPDIIVGGDGNDTMAGNAGDDVFIGGLGNDTMAGGAGFDRFVEMTGAATVTNNTSKVATSSDTFSQIEQIELTGTNNSEAFTLTNVNLIVLLNAGDGVDTLAYTGDGNVVLTNNLLTRTQGTATYNLSLTTIESLRLNGGQSNDSFNVTAWTKSLILSGGAGTDAIVAANDVNYAISDTFLQRTGLFPIAQSAMENALLTGGASANTFDISGWTKAATLNGNGGTDKLVVVDNVATTLSNTTLTRTGRTNVMLASIEAAEITDGAGNNAINASTFSGQLRIDGGAGNDTITGGTGPSLLIGGLANDVIKSGTGRTVQIGGLGLDKLTGNTNGDLLIAGQTAHDNNAAALAAILAEWASASSYLDRVAHLTTATTGLNGSARLDGGNVTHDNAIDVLLGAAGEDLFFAKQVSATGSPKDTYTDKASGESIF
jgi:Ca2+-binding RTX toxin-like protein